MPQLTADGVSASAQRVAGLSDREKTILLTAWTCVARVPDLDLDKLCVDCDLSNRSNAGRVWLDLKKKLGIDGQDATPNRSGRGGRNRKRKRAGSPTTGTGTPTVQDKKDGKQDTRGMASPFTVGDRAGDGSIGSGDGSSYGHAMPLPAGAGQPSVAGSDSGLPHASAFAPFSAGPSSTKSPCATAATASFVGRGTNFVAGQLGAGVPTGSNQQTSTWPFGTPGGFQAPGGSTSAPPTPSAADRAAAANIMAAVSRLPGLRNYSPAGATQANSAPVTPAKVTDAARFPGPPFATTALAGPSTVPYKTVVPTKCRVPKTPGTAKANTFQCPAGSNGKKSVAQQLHSRTPETKPHPAREAKDIVALIKEINATAERIATAAADTAATSSFGKGNDDDDDDVDRPATSGGVRLVAKNNDGGVSGGSDSIRSEWKVTDG
ncbi:hypothetical protein HMPREF1624_01609 [Sporothrix schenckii ATCC 58251]|uniref:Uncharacterized protein n=1 Tax=Sporothrix schenckii (strain ATCC 58251 / de Perez 2211183) TaxID=1391915 RepID=U7Q8A7_SPOS1|nr:hypothetical protein HMPREF1624_01609 [Sporothrix schenckii ATCC 58251]